MPGISSRTVPCRAVGHACNVVRLPLCHVQPSRAPNSGHIVRAIKTAAKEWRFFPAPSETRSFTPLPSPLRAPNTTWSIAGSERTSNAYPTLGPIIDGDAKTNPSRSGSPYPCPPRTTSVALDAPTPPLAAPQISSEPAVTRRTQSPRRANPRDAHTARNNKHTYRLLFPTFRTAPIRESRYFSATPFPRTASHN
jgi:hypothetical protein